MTIDQQDKELSVHPDAQDLKEPEDHILDVDMTDGYQVEHYRDGTWQIWHHENSVAQSLIAVSKKRTTIAEASFNIGEEESAEDLPTLREAAAVEGQPSWGLSQRALVQLAQRGSQEAQEEISRRERVGGDLDQGPGGMSKEEFRNSYLQAADEEEYFDLSSL